MGKSAMAIIATASLLLLTPVSVSAQQTPPPPWFAGTIEPGTVTWYRGCTTIRTSQLFCDFIATAQVLGGTPGYPAPYTIFFSQFPGGGVSYMDIWAWTTPNVPSCTGVDSSYWIPASCAPYMKQMTLGVAIDWWDENGEFHRQRMLFNSVSTPEPVSIALVATGLIAIGGGALKRRRRTRDAD